MTDTHYRICIDISLWGENFIIYNYEKEESLFVGVNLNHFKKMLKPIKKKDSVELIIDSEDMENLCIKIIPKEGSKVTTSFIKLQNIQNIDLELPLGYKDCVTIPALDYQKICKDMESISPSIEIKATDTTIRFTADMSCVYSRSIIFGEGSDEDEGRIIYLQHFESDKLNNLGKISGLGASSSNHIQIYFDPKLPILFRTNVGTLGKINVYVKGKEQTENDTEVS
jgi:proliferating cell nuclear antigen